MTTPLLAAWLVMAALTATPAVSAPDVREVVRCTEVAFSRAAERRDLDAFLAFVHPDARFVGAAVQRGRDEIAAAWRPFFAADGPSLAWRPELVEVLPDGTLALTRGAYRLRQRDEQGAWQESWGTFTSVWRLAPDGRWRIAFDAGGLAPRAPTAELEALFAAPPGCPDEP